MLISPNIYKSIFIAPAFAGDSTIWTPTSGKRFRLLKYGISVTRSTADISAKLVNITFKDGSTATPFILTFSVPTPDVALQSILPGCFDIDRYLDGIGYLSAAANNALVVNVDSSLNLDSTCGLRVSVYGTEE